MLGFIDKLRTKRRILRAEIRMLQYNLLVLVFSIITIVKLQQSLEAAMLDVLLPVLLLLPAIYDLRIPHLPAVSGYDAVLLPLGIAALVCRSHNWRFQRNDLWVIAFALGALYTDYLNLGPITALDNFLEPGPLGGVLAYIIGKLLIEQTGNRKPFANRMVVLLTAVGFISVTEFIGKRNMFVAISHRFFGHADYWGDELRSGFLRVKGPFMGAEEAGIVFLVGFFLALWIWSLNRYQNNQQEPKYFGLHRSTIYIVGILLGSAMTLSRGPLLGIGAGFLVARIGLVKKRRLAVALALVLIAVASFGARQRAAAYSSKYNDQSTNAIAGEDESEASAMYRTRLYNVYEPVAQKGGLFGWSATAYPRVGAFSSIDNEYLLLWVTQGKVGLTLFLLIVAEGALAIVLAIRRSQLATDTWFYYCLGGMLAGLAVVLITVFLAGQGYILFFLCSGWIQSLPDDRWARRHHSRFSFRRVYT
jgi:O-Antigen ligase